MTTKCRAKDSSTCKVHGTGGLYNHLRRVSNEAINNRDFDAYYEARDKMESLTDDSKAALRFYDRGGVPTLAEKVGNKLNAFADSILDARDNINEKVYNALDGDPAEHPVGSKIANFADSILDARDNINEKVYNALENPPENSETFRAKMENKAFDIMDHIEETRDTFNGAVSEGLDEIVDRHTGEIPAEIGGSTVEWADMNPFKSRNKN